MLSDVLDTPDALNIRIYLKKGDVSVYGHYVGRDDSIADPWIAVKEPTVIYNDGSREEFENCVVYLIRVADVDHMVVE